MDVPGFALVTGAASGIGRATAKAFAAEGCAGLALFDVNENSLKDVRREIEELTRAHPNKPCRVLVATLDVTNEEAVTAAVQKAASSFGRLDYVVNCAGIAAKDPGGIVNTSTETWRRILDVNLDGTFWTVRAAAKIMLEQEPLSAREGRAPQRGSIVNLSSILGLVGLGSTAAYVASKHAVLGLSRSAAVDYAAQGVRVNAVCPGYTETPMTTNPEFVTAQAGMGRSIADVVPMKRMGRPEEIADCILFLAGGRSSFVTGSAVNVDGGYLAI